MFFVCYSTLYFISSKTAHRFVGYLEEEAISTYTTCINDIDNGLLPIWKY